MKRKIFLLALLTILIFNIGFSQDSILVKTSYLGKYTGKKFEEYYINSSDSLKNGSYKMFSTNGKVIQIGNFIKGKPIGIWHFYEDNVWNRKCLSFDFDNYKEIFYKNFSREKAHCSIKTSQGFKLKSVDSIARFPGGAIGLSYYLKENLKLDLRNISFRRKMLLEIVIEESGKVGELKISNELAFDKNIRDEIIRVFRNMPNWIPAIDNGRSVVSKYTQPIRF